MKLLGGSDMKVGVIMGGVSSEREVSLKTGKEVARAFNRKKYEIVEININSEGELLNKIKGIDFAFIALHGSFGEDGKVQALLENIGIPYSGCGVLSSALCMDKNLSKKLFKAENLLTPRWTLARTGELDWTDASALGFPLVVKPNSGGSSIGTFIVRDEKALKSAVEEALKYDKEVIIEEYIDGNEITCCLLNGELLPVLSIKPKGEFFNYSSKYEDGGAEEIIVTLPEEINNQVAHISTACWKLFKLKAYGRIDMIIKEDKVYVLEINTLPGMTANSLFPRSAKGYDLTFSELLDKIIEYSK
jgi:D-alanine-D-alanine ligase